MSVRKIMGLSLLFYLLWLPQCRAQQESINKLLDAFYSVFTGARTPVQEAPVPAEPARPEISLKTDPGKINYVHQNKTVICNGIPAAGCTSSVIYMEPLRVDLTVRGEIKKIYLTLGIENLVVEVSSEYPKGTCEFDLVLKHELTHVAVARRVLDRYAPEMAKALLVKAESLPVPVNQLHYNQLLAQAQGFFSRMVREKERQDDLLDAPGANVYQWSQCQQGNSRMQPGAGSRNSLRTGGGRYR